MDTTERLNFPLQVADGLVKVQVALGNIASKRERVKVLYKKSIGAPRGPLPAARGPRSLLRA